MVVSSRLSLSSSSSSSMLLLGVLLTTVLSIILNSRVTDGFSVIPTTTTTTKALVVVVTKTTSKTQTSTTTTIATSPACLQQQQQQPARSRRPRDYPNNNNLKLLTRLNQKTVSTDGKPVSEDMKYSYAEESRKYRRTVFTHDDWIKHRSSDRYIRQLNNIVNSGVYKNLLREVSVVTSVAIIIFIYNMFVNGYTDLAGINHQGILAALPPLSLPLTPFTLSSPSLGLLLVFRTNTSYKRWDEARKNWGMNINHTRDLVRMGASFYDDSVSTPDKRAKDLKQLSLATWSFVRSMKRHLSPGWDDEQDFKDELYEKLPQEQANAIINAAHRPNRALFDLSVAIENLPMHFLRKNEVHKACTIFEDNLGSSERLLTSPVPLFYSRHLARFLFIWMMLLPFALYEPFKDTWNHIGMIPAELVIATFLFGIEELAAQMEEPFTILPMQAFCDKIGNWCNEITSWTPGDNGMPTLLSSSNKPLVVWDK